MNVVLPPPPPAGPPQKITSCDGAHAPSAAPTGNDALQRKTPLARVPLNGAVALHEMGDDEAAVIWIETESTPGVLTSRTLMLDVSVAPDPAVAVAGAMVIRSSDVPAVTVIVATAELPSDVAEIVAVPASSPVTTPPEAAHAIGGAVVAITTTAPETTAPSASRTVG